MVVVCFRNGLCIRRIALRSQSYYYYRSSGEAWGDYWRRIRRDAEFYYYRCCYLCCCCYLEDSSAKSLRRVRNSRETGGLRGCGETREIEKETYKKSTKQNRWLSRGRRVWRGARPIGIWRNESFILFISIVFGHFQNIYYLLERYPQYMFPQMLF